MTEQPYDTMRRELTGFLARLQHADAAPRDFKVTAAEIETALVANWRATQPQDQNLSKLRHYAESAVAMRAAVEASPRDPSRAQDPKTRLLSSEVALSLGREGRAGTGNELSADFLQTRLREHARALNKPVSEQWLATTAQEVHEGMKVTRWMESRLEAVTIDIMKQLERNTLDLGLAQSKLASTRRGAAEMRAVDAEEAQQSAATHAALSAAFGNNAAGRRMAETIADGKGNAGMLSPADQAKIRDNTNLSPAVKKLFAEGADFGEIQKQIMREIESRVYAKADENIRARAAEAKPGYAEHVAMLEKLRANAQKSGNAAMVQIYDQQLAMFRNAPEQPAPPPSPRAAPTPEKWDQKDTEKLGLSEQQQSEIIALREQVARYTLDTSGAPTAAGVARAIEQAQRGR